MIRMMLPASLLLAATACATGVRTSEGGDDSGADIELGDNINEDGDVLVEGDARCPVTLDGKNFGTVEVTEEPIAKALTIDYTQADIVDCPEMVLTGTIIEGERWNVTTVSATSIAPGNSAVIIVTLDATTPGSAAGIIEVTEQFTDALNATIVDTGNSGSDDTGGEETGEETTWYRDADGDLHGDPLDIDGDGNPGYTSSDGPPTDGYSYVENSGDCDDSEASIHVGATEQCNGVDDDCDGDVDEDVVDQTWYADTDGDLHGDPDNSIDDCTQPSGYVSDDTDCDDTDASIHPGATETWYDGVDSDCDGGSEYDQDGDGHDSDAYGGDDCDDTDATINPSATDAWYDGVDSDCDGANDYDQDGDGHESDAYGGDDCDDADATISPSATETWYDGVDSDCDGGSDYDQDGDSFDSDVYGGGDCDDSDSSVNPTATETWYDGIDSDCDGGSDYDQDGDGEDSSDYGGSDCVDTDASIDSGTNVYVETDISYGSDASADSGLYCADANGYEMPDGWSGVTWNVCGGTMRYSCNTDDVSIDAIEVDGVSWSADAGPDHTTCSSGRTWSGGMPTNATCWDISTFY